MSLWRGTFPMFQSVRVNVLYSLANHAVTQVSFLNGLFLLVTFRKLKRDNLKWMCLTHFYSKVHNILTVVAFPPGGAELVDQFSYFLMVATIYLAVLWLHDLGARPRVQRKAVSAPSNELLCTQAGEARVLETHADLCSLTPCSSPLHPCLSPASQSLTKARAGWREESAGSHVSAPHEEGRLTWKLSMGRQHNPSWASTFRVELVLSNKSNRISCQKWTDPCPLKCHLTGFQYEPLARDYWKNHSFDHTDLCRQSNVSAS